MSTDSDMSDERPLIARDSARRSSQVDRPPRRRKFDSTEYHAMRDDGFFLGQRIELIDGDVIQRRDDVDKPPRRRRFNRHEYRRMTVLGMFDNQRVELIDGDVIRMSPQTNEHARSVTKIVRLLIELLPRSVSVRPQLPLGLGERGEPEPDIALVKDDFDNRDHPSSADLVIEVATSSLERDRKKASIYAAAGVTEYWIVDLKRRAVEVRTGLVKRPNSKHGWDHGNLVVHLETEVLETMMLPGRDIPVRDLLP